VHGGLFQSKCADCNWEAAGTVSYRWPGPPSIPESVLVLADGEVSAQALKYLRSLSGELSRTPPQQLKDRLMSGGKVALGTHGAGRARELQSALEALGLVVERVPLPNAS
jgi:hypothetical protein